MMAGDVLSMLRVVFMGSGDVACPALERMLAAADLSVVAVVTQPDRPHGRRRQLSACPAKRVAEGRGVHVLTPERVGAPEVVSALSALRPDLLVVADYGQFIPSSLIDLAPLGAINIHPSLLPKYRGASPIQWALANGDAETGVTILYVEQEMDAGDILAQEPLAIDPDDTGLTLTPKLADLGADLLMRVIADLQAGRVTARPQDPAAVTVVRKLDKEDGRIDWSMSAEAIRNRVRGFLPWPGSFTHWPGGRLKVLSARVEPMASGAHVPGTLIDCGGDGPLVATGEGALRLTAIQPEGRKVMGGEAFLCGYTLKPGERFE